MFLFLWWMFFLAVQLICIQFWFLRNQGDKGKTWAPVGADSVPTALAGLQSFPVSSNLLGWIQTRSAGPQLLHLCSFCLEERWREQHPSVARARACCSILGEFGLLVAFRNTSCWEVTFMLCFVVWKMGCVELFFFKYGNSRTNQDSGCGLFVFLIRSHCWRFWEKLLGEWTCFHHQSYRLKESV